MFTFAGIFFKLLSSKRNRGKVSDSSGKNADISLGPDRSSGFKHIVGRNNIVPVNSRRQPKTLARAREIAWTFAPRK
jgi:hypothetical protein